jgi:hypothetical protein
MGNTVLGEAHVPVRAVLDKLDGDLSKARSKVNASLDKIAGHLQTAGAGILSGVGAAAGVIAGIGTALGLVTIDSAPIKDISDAFDGLADSAGIGGKAMLDALKDGSAGMVANRDLMKSFNNAASLVSLDFAKRLPDAMKYLSKVSMSTGDDMNYLLDSLVTGVGRVSPPILDNLKIQASLAEATARAAEMFGVEESSLSKAQIQAGMMDVVLEKLKANTESMPDVTQSAAAGLSKMKAKFQDTKDRIGTSFLPTLNTVLTVFERLSGKYVPVLVDKLDKLAPTVEYIAAVFGNFLLDLANGQSPIEAFGTLIGNLLPPELATNIMTIVQQVQDFSSQVWEAIQPIVAFVLENVKLSDVLTGIGVAVGTVVIPAIVSIITAIAPVIGTFLAVVAVVALLRSAWESDFLGIRTALTDFWENKAKPALKDLVAWLQDNVPQAIEKLKGFWENTLLPALKKVWDFISTNIMPIFNTIVDFINTLFIVALKVIGAYIVDVMVPNFKKMYDYFTDKVLPVIQKVANWLNEKLQPAFDGISKVVQDVLGWIRDLTEKLKNLDVSKIFKPGSPTPFEIGLRGIEGALSDLSGKSLPQFSARLNLLPEVPGVSGFLTGSDSGSQLDTSQLEAKIDSLGRILPVAFRDAVRMMQ